MPEYIYLFTSCLEKKQDKKFPVLGKTDQNREQQSDQLPALEAKKNCL